MSVIERSRPEYRIWQAMLNRCRNPRQSNYKFYGGRGIRVCERWKSFAAFFADMGERPSAAYSIDRIDSDKNYEPGNCRWLLNDLQKRNTRTNRMLTLNGETKCAAEWAEITGIHYRTIIQRANRGWSDEKTLTHPVRVWP